MTGITEIAESLSSELKRRLPKQRKTQRTKLALLVSTMLNVRSANLMDLAAGLPREADRTGPLDPGSSWVSGCWIWCQATSALTNAPRRALPLLRVLWMNWKNPR
jgi:hypothetical protein